MEHLDNSAGLKNDIFMPLYENLYDPIKSTIWIQDDWLSVFSMICFYIIAIYVGDKVIGLICFYASNFLSKLWNKKLKEDDKFQDLVVVRFVDLISRFWNRISETGLFQKFENWGMLYYHDIRNCFIIINSVFSVIAIYLVIEWHWYGINPNNSPGYCLKNESFSFVKYLGPHENTCASYFTKNSFDLIKLKVWIRENFHYFIIISVFSIIAIFLVFKLRKSMYVLTSNFVSNVVNLIYKFWKSIFERKAVFIEMFKSWRNCGMAIFSIIGVVLLMPELYLDLISLNEAPVSSFKGVTSFWSNLFFLLKVGEVIETVFIGFKKRELRSPHAYYQIAVLFYIWRVFATASGRWLILLDYVVHAFMYSYFVIRTFKSPVPIFLRMIVIFFELAQMVFAVYVGSIIWKILSVGYPCQYTWSSLYFCFSIYFLYFLLVWKLFYNAYSTKIDHVLNTNSDEDDLMVIVDFIDRSWRNICGTKLFQKFANWIHGVENWLSRFDEKPTVTLKEMAQLNAEIYIGDKFLEKWDDENHSREYNVCDREFKALGKTLDEARELVETYGCDRKAVLEYKLDPELERLISEIIERHITQTD